MPGLIFQNSMYTCYKLLVKNNVTLRRCKLTSNLLFRKEHDNAYFLSIRCFLNGSRLTSAGRHCQMCESHYAYKRTCIFHVQSKLNKELYIQAYGEAHSNVKFLRKYRHIEPSSNIRYAYKKKRTKCSSFKILEKYVNFDSWIYRVILCQIS